MASRPLGNPLRKMGPDHIFKRYDPVRYQSPHELGRGSYGIVYSMYDVETDLTIVVKIVPKKLAAGKIINESSVLREVGILSNLRRNCDQHIVCYIDFKEDVRNFYIITEFLEHYIMLSKYIAQTDMTYDQYITVIEGLKAGVHHFNALGVAHRDIKPDNVMINPTTLDVKYIDFGLSCHLSTCYLKDKAGTPLYMAPDVILGIDIPEYRPSSLFDWIKADYWSLGMVIMEMAIKRTFLEYFAMRYLGYPLNDFPELNTTAQGLIKADFPRKVFDDYYLDNFSQQPQLIEYFKQSVEPLLKRNPFDRMLILSKIDRGTTTFYQDEPLVEA